MGHTLVPSLPGICGFSSENGTWNALTSAPLEASTVFLTNKAQMLLR